MRPLLNPALRRVWRDATTLQLGEDPERAVILAGLDAASARVLDDLDGTRERHEVVEAARYRGVTRQRAGELLELLATSGALLDAERDPPDPLADLTPAEGERLAPDLASAGLLDQRGGAAVLARRRSAIVEVHGLGRVGAAVSLLLAAAGVGRVIPYDCAPSSAADLPVGLDPAHVGRRRDAALRGTLGRVAPSTQTRAARADARTDMAVVAGAPVRGPTVDDLLRAGVPHLFAAVRDTVGIIGPFVLPGRSSCSRCMDLHRRDRDPSWPQVFAQLLDGGRPGRASAPACDSALATAVAAHTVLHALTWLDRPGEPQSAVDATFEIALPDGRIRRRSWSAHPECGCRWERTG